MKYFGTDGIRREGNWFLKDNFLSRFSYAIASLGIKKVAIGRDTRLTGQEIETELTTALSNFGVDTIVLGIVPTPCVCYFAKINQCYGIMISASHNPPEYNGLKVIDNFGNKLSDILEEKLESYFELHFCESACKGAKDFVNGKKFYIDILIHSLKVDFSGCNILLDCGYGAMSFIAKEAFEALGANVDVICEGYLGDKINVACGATHLDNITSYSNYDICFSYDGDGDRVIAKAKNGDVLDGDNFLALLANYIKTDKICATVMSNYGMIKYLQSIDKVVEVVGVGDKYIQRYMNNSNCLLGGEQSGHIIVGGIANTGDGLLSSLMFLAAMIELRLDSNDIGKIYKPYYQILTNIKCDTAILDRIDFSSIEREIEKKGRFLVRPSGTEPLVRVLVECQSEEDTINYSNLISEKIKELL